MTKKGLGIVEMVVIIGLVALVSLVLVEIFISHNRLYRIALTETEVQSGNFVAMSQISAAIKESKRVLSNITIGADNFTTGTDTLVLELPAFETDGDPIIGFDNVIIFIDPLDTTKVYLQTQAVAGSKRLTGKKLLTSQLKEINFKYNSADPAQASAVTVYLQTLQTSFSISDQAVSTSTVFLQNK